MQQNVKEQIQKMSVDERIVLVEEIWDGIAEENGAVELTQEQKQELDRRLDFLEKNPGVGRTWDEIQNDLRTKR